MIDFANNFYVVVREDGRFVFEDVSSVYPTIISHSVRRLYDGTLVLSAASKADDIPLKELNWSEYRGHCRGALKLKDFLEMTRKHQSYCINFEFPEAAYAAAVEMICESIAADRYLYTSHNPVVLKQLGLLDEEASLGLLLTFDGKTDITLQEYLSLVLHRNRYTVYDFILSPIGVAELPFISHLYRKRLIVSPVNNVDSIIRTLRHKQHYCGIMTDCPSFIINVLH